MTPSDVYLESLAIRNSLKANMDMPSNPIDLSLDPVKPFQLSYDIQLIIIGQDPTIQNINSRKNISSTLNLDKNGSLKNYIERVCRGLGITLQHVYATNIFKYFYTHTPATTIEVLEKHLAANLVLLKKELASFPNAKVMTLGEPVLRLLEGKKAFVKNYWDYDQKTRVSGGNYTHCLACNNQLGKDIFVFPHQPSLRKEFYKNYLDKYISFMRIYDK